MLSYRDGFSGSATARVGCTVSISENMHDTSRFGSLEVVAPFVDGDVNPRPRSLLADG